MYKNKPDSFRSHDQSDIPTCQSVILRTQSGSQDYVRRSHSSDSFMTNCPPLQKKKKLSAVVQWLAGWGFGEMSMWQRMHQVLQARCVGRGAQGSIVLKECNTGFSLFLRTSSIYLRPLILSTTVY